MPQQPRGVMYYAFTHGLASLSRPSTKEAMSTKTTRGVAYHAYDPVLYLGNLLLGQPLDGLKATKEVGAG